MAPMSMHTMKKYSYYVYPRTTISFKGAEYYTRKCMLEKYTECYLNF